MPSLFVRPVIGVTIHLLELAHERIAGICSGTLIVEGLLHHLIQCGQERLLLDAVFPDGLVNSNLCFQLINGNQQVVEFLLIVGPLDAEDVRTFRVALQRVGGPGTAGRFPFF